MREKNIGSLSGKAEFWSIQPDGNDNRREWVDSLSDRIKDFSWSPDGRSICWIRDFSDQWQEIVVCELTTGKDRQVTFDQKRIADVCWTFNNSIIFSSERSGNFNLWMVPASGGAITQVTKGTGPDYVSDISRDGSKLLFHQQQQISHIWVAGTDGSNPHQITFDDAFLWRVAFTYDGKQIIFGYFHPLGSKKGASVCSIDRDGGNRRELTSREEEVGNPIPSPNGRWIIYGGRPYNAPSDSMKVYLIDAGNPGMPKFICNGCPFRWIDEKSFILWDFNDRTKSTWMNSIEGGESHKIFQDSTFAFPLQGGKYIGYSDQRSGRQGYWICSAAGTKDSSQPSPKRILEFSTAIYGEFDKNGNYFYYVKNAGQLCRVSIPSGKQEIINGVFPGLNPTFSHSNFDISYDGKEIVYTDARFNSKLVMIENPFK